MPASEARLYFVVTVKGDLGPFSKQELREQLRTQAFASGDRVRNAFGRPLGSVSEVLGSSSQMALPTAAGGAAARPHAPARPRSAAPPWPILAAVGAVLLILVLLWAGSGGAPTPSPSPPPSAPPLRATTTATSPAQPAVAGSLPEGFSYLDLGDARPRGSAHTGPDGTIIVNGGGADIWDDRDECAYAHRTLDGNASITVELRSMQKTDAWDKAGIMLRASTDPSAPHVSILAIHSGRIQFVTRARQGGRSGDTHVEVPRFPVWLRLTRAGANVTGAFSRDGQSWTDVGSSQVDAMPRQAVIGLAVSSHNRSVTNRTVFSGLSIVPAP